jgi:hypothetical protein
MIIEISHPNRRYLVYIAYNIADFCVSIETKPDTEQEGNYINVKELQISHLI